MPVGAIGSDRTLEIVPETAWRYHWWDLRPVGQRERLVARLLRVELLLTPSEKCWRHHPGQRRGAPALDPLSCQRLLFHPLADALSLAVGGALEVGFMKPARKPFWKS